MNWTDHCDDETGRRAKELVVRYNLEPMVKNATLTDLGVGLERDWDRFVRMKHYPAHTKSATILSYAALRDGEDALPAEEYMIIADRLRVKAAEFNVTAAFAHIDATNRRLKEAESAVLDDSNYAFVREVEGEKVRHMRIANVSEVKEAAEWIFKHRREFLYNDRRDIAERILKQAERLGTLLVDRGDDIARMAGRGTCLPKEAAEYVRSRSFTIQSEDAQGAEHLKNMASVFERKPSIEQQHLVKFAEMIDELDREQKIEWCSSTPAPEDFLFAITAGQVRKFASESLPLTNGYVYQAGDLSRLPLAALSGRLGSDVAESVALNGAIDCAKAAEHLSILPMDDADLLTSLLDSYGIAPIAKEASALENRRLTKEILDVLAAA